MFNDDIQAHSLVDVYERLKNCKRADSEHIEVLHSMLSTIGRSLKSGRKSTIATTGRPALSGGSARSWRSPCGRAYDSTS